MPSVGEQFPKEQARVREVLQQYKAIGPAGAFGAALIEGTLAQADVAYPETAVLTIVEVARWLGISKRAAERLDIPHLYLGTRTRRFLGSTVLEYLKKRELAA